MGLHDGGELRRAVLAADEGRNGAVLNLVPHPPSGAVPAHGFEIFQDGGGKGTPTHIRGFLPYPGCPDWGTWRFARHLADLTSREYLYALRRSAIFDAGSAARMIMSLAARDGYDFLAFLSERPRPGRELRWAWAAPHASLNASFAEEPGARPGQIRLAKFAYDVPGFRDTAGRMLFSEDIRALVVGLNAWLAEMDSDPMVPYQKWAGSEGPWSFALPIGGEWCPCRLKSGEGRVEISLSAGIAERLRGLIDDQDRHGGRLLVYEWTPGHTASAFVGKLKAEMDRAYDLLSENPVSMN